jgi:hypothetical protein
LPIHFYHEDTDMFTVTHDVLLSALKRCKFTLSGSMKSIVIVGVRAALPKSISQSAAAFVELERTSIDNLHPRCTLLIWDLDKQLVSAFPGSTVPHLSYVMKARAKAGEGANELAHGLHRGYAKGLHPSTPGKHQHRALRIARNLPVLRTIDDLDFDANDAVDYAVAFDNIHCGWVADTSRATFASAGCQVVVGFANPPSGPWKAFEGQIYATPQQEFDYVLFGSGEIARVAGAPQGTKLPLAMRYGSQGDAVEALQDALIGAGYPVQSDGDFGIGTFKAVRAFQRSKMNDPDPDGVAGEQTLTALGLDVFDPMPIETVVPTSAETHETIAAVGGPTDTVLAAIALAKGPALEISKKIFESGRPHYYAKEVGKDYDPVYVGMETKPNPTTATFHGLVHHVPFLEAAGGTKYSVSDWTTDFGDIWPNLIVPTAKAESALYFERINTYDRAKFTFGFFQAAAHYPEANFIIVLRDLLGLPEAREWFPELSLIQVNGKMRVHRDDKGTLKNLETVTKIPRPEGRIEPQLVDFMDWLNPTLDVVEEEEIDVAARFCLWTKLSKGARRVQVKLAIQGLQERMNYLKNELKNRPVAQCILAADSLYQGRARVAALKTALASADPYKELQRFVGGTNAPHKGRVDTVVAEIKKLPFDIAKLKFDPQSPDLFS